MKKYILFFCFIFFFVFACWTSKERTPKIKNNSSKIDRIVENALQFKGIKYRSGGTTKKGMDCSGVVFTAFKNEGILLPRSSRDMAKKGKEISLENVKKGDLLFFKTYKKNKNINHVGLITSVTKDQVFFIHATTQKGVVISSLSENYWETTYVKSVKVL